MTQSHTTLRHGRRVSCWLLALILFLTACARPGTPATPTPAALAGDSSSLRALAISPNGATIAGASSIGIQTWDTAQRTEGSTFRVERKEITAWNAVTFSRDSSLLFGGSSRGDVVAWQLSDGTVRRTFAGFNANDDVQSLALSPDGRLLAAGTWTITSNVPHVALRLWAFDSGATIRAVPLDDPHVWDLAFSPDGTLLVGAVGKTVVWWEAGTGREVAVLRGHADEVRRVAFSPDGKLLATVSDDGTARLWDVATRAEMRVLRGHTDLVWGLAFSPDGQTLATGSDDVTTRLWSVADGQERQVLRGHANDARHVAFTPDGRTLVTAGYDKVLLRPVPADTK